MLVVAADAAGRYITPVSLLTRQEQLVLCAVLGLLLIGWAVKTYRTTQLPAEFSQRVTP